MEQSHEQNVVRYKSFMGEIQLWAKALHNSVHVVEYGQALDELFDHFEEMQKTELIKYPKDYIQQQLHDVQEILRKHPRDEFIPKTIQTPDDVMCEKIKKILDYKLTQVEVVEVPEVDEWERVRDKPQHMSSSTNQSGALVQGHQPHLHDNNSYYTEGYLQNQPPENTFVNGSYDAQINPLNMRSDRQRQQHVPQVYQQQRPLYHQPRQHLPVLPPVFIRQEQTTIQNIFVNPASNTPQTHPPHNQFNDVNRSYGRPQSKSQHQSKYQTEPTRHQNATRRRANREKAEKEEAKSGKPNSGNVTRIPTSTSTSGIHATRFNRPYSGKQTPDPTTSNREPDPDPGVKNRLQQDAGKVFPLGSSEGEKTKQQFDQENTEEQLRQFAEKLEKQGTKNKELKKEVDKKDRELDRLKTDLKKAKKDQHAKTQELKALKNDHVAKVESLKKDIDEKNKSVSELEDQLKEGKARFDLMKNETAPLNTLRDELAALLGIDTNDMESIKDQVKLLKTDLERARKDQHAKTTELDNLKNAHDAKVKSLEEEIEKKNESVRKLESQLKDETAALITIRDELAALLDTDPTDMESIKDKVKLLKTENKKNATLLTEMEKEKSGRAEENSTLAELQNTNGNLQNKITELETNRENEKAERIAKQSELQDAREMIRSFETQVEKLTTENAEQTKSLTKLQEEKEDIGKQIQQCESKVQEHKTTITKLETDLKKEKAERTAEKFQLEDAHKKDTESLQTQVENLKKENWEKAALMKKLEEEKAKLNAEKDNQGTELNSRQEKLDSLMAEIQKKDETVKNLQSQLESEKAQVVSLTTTIQEKNESLMQLESQTKHLNEEQKKWKDLEKTQNDEIASLKEKVANLEENGRIPAEHVSSQEVQELRTKLAETKEKYKKIKEEMQQQVSHSRTMDNDRLHDKDYLRYFFESSVISQPDEVNGMLMRASIEAISRLNPTPIAPSPRAGTSQISLAPVLDIRHGPAAKKRKLELNSNLKLKKQIIQLKGDEESEEIDEDNEQERRVENAPNIDAAQAPYHKFICKHCGAKFSHKSGKSRHELHTCPKNDKRTPMPKPPNNGKKSTGKNDKKKKTTTEIIAKKTVVATAQSSTPSKAPSSASTASKSTAQPSTSNASSLEDGHVSDNSD